MNEVRFFSIACIFHSIQSDATREQLVNFRRIVRKSDKKAASAEELQIRALQDSIAKAQSLANKQFMANYTDVVRYRIVLL
jgi:hypothetical protein